MHNIVQKKYQKIQDNTKKSLKYFAKVPKLLGIG